MLEINDCWILLMAISRGFFLLSFATTENGREKKIVNSSTATTTKNQINFVELKKKRNN